MDVAENPVALNNCEHIFCLKCIDNEGLVKCPSCQGPILNGRLYQLLRMPKWHGLEGGLLKWYKGLRIKCLNSSCDQILTANNVTVHDNSCPITFETCDDCGHKSKRGSSNVHSCDQQRKLVDMEKRWQLMRQREETLKNNSFWVGVQLLIAVIAIVIGFMVKIQWERKRMEDLVTATTYFRNSFGTGLYAGQSSLVTWMRELKSRDMSNGAVVAFKKIIEQYDN